jgi:hypothetical protein
MSHDDIDDFFNNMVDELLELLGDEVLRKGGADKVLPVLQKQRELGTELFKQLRKENEQMRLQNEALRRRLVGRR